MPAIMLWPMTAVFFGVSFTEFYRREAEKSRSTNGDEA